MPAPETDRARRIAILSPEVADAIAAGEVVDRPAAVVKELMENALDASATHIAVRVEDAGRQLIEVVDDGTGILPEDLPLAFQRHATSKIASLPDMRSIATLGFRGEALASIAAVAVVEAVSRVRGRGGGARILMEAGASQAVGRCGSPAGTRVTVRRLFFNTPARLAFLKQPATENAAIVRVVSELALARPDVMVQLSVDGKPALATPGSGGLRAAFAAIHDPATAAAMVDVDQGPVQGLISPPALHRASRDLVVILVNGRRIHHRNLAYAVEQAYRGLRDPDRFPLAVLDLRIDPAEVDVNVHPTKREVRLRNEGAAFAALERACYHALRRSPLYQAQALEDPPGLRLRETVVFSPLPLLPAPPEVVADPGAAARLPALTFVGQLLNAYLVAEAPEVMVLVDQHAAHERVLFDRILSRPDRRSEATQLFLVPPVLDLTPAQLSALRQHEDWLQRLGFGIEEFGASAVRLRAGPAELREGTAGTVLVRLLEELQQEVRPQTRDRHAAALLACHGAVRFGDQIAPEAARALLAALAQTAQPISCPHGRPTTVVLADQELRRLFRRP